MMYRWELRKEPDIDTVLDSGHVLATDLLSALVWAQADIGLGGVEPLLVEEMRGQDAVWAQWFSGKTLRIEGVRR